MRHRGPDGWGEFSDADLDPRIHVTMTRLSIIDLLGGQQPLRNEDRSVAVVANGEIYNFGELRKGLEARGHRFGSNSDCESIAHLYEECGLKFVESLRGMFAIALWDSLRRKLILARDRMGEKSIYLFQTEERLYFASEMKALLQCNKVNFDLDPVAVNEYLHFGWVPGPRTILRGVRKLQPGCMLIVDIDNWSVLEHRYWSFDSAEPVTGDAKQLIRAELERISEQIVRSDVPVGIALSGGLDSSAIAALIARSGRTDIRAFTVGYEGTPHQDERELAKAFGKHIGLGVTEVEVPYQQMLDDFDELNYWRDDPIADIAGYGYFVLSRAARQSGCPVLIQGQGGDELFWGYAWSVRAVEETKKLAVNSTIGWLPALRSILPQGLSRPQMIQFAYLLGSVFYGWRRLRKRRYAPHDEIAFYDLCDTFQIGMHAAESTYTSEFREALRGHSATDFFRIPKPWARSDLLIMRLLCESYLLENGLTQGDRLSMANSVELRLPLVDYKLVELVVGLQKADPSSAMPSKKWFKDSVGDLLPNWVMERPKRGFNPPVSSWGSALRGRYGKGLADGFLVGVGVLERSAAIRMVGSHSRFSPWHDLCFKYLVLESWCRSMNSSSVHSAL